MMKDQALQFQRKDQEKIQTKEKRENKELET